MWRLKHIIAMRGSAGFRVTHTHTHTHKYTRPVTHFSSHTTLQAATTDAESQSELDTRRSSSHRSGPDRSSSIHESLSHHRSTSHSRRSDRDNSIAESLPSRGPASASIKTDRSASEEVRTDESSRSRIRTETHSVTSDYTRGGPRRTASTVSSASAVRSDVSLESSPPRGQRRGKAQTVQSSVDSVTASAESLATAISAASGSRADPVSDGSRSTQHSTHTVSSPARTRDNKSERDHSTRSEASLALPRFTARLMDERSVS